MLLILLLLCSTATASESTIVLTDNTVIKTVHHYDEARLTSDTGNWDDVAILNPSAEAECFDRIANFRNRADRYQQLESCLTETGILG